LAYEYWNNRFQINPSSGTGTHSTINFNWGTGSPFVSGQADNFSFRWSGSFVPTTTGLHQFQTVTDDGVRLSVGGNLVINQWYDQGPTAHTSGLLSLDAGTAYEIEMDFYENGGGAVAQLLWSTPNRGFHIIPQEVLYPTTSGPGDTLPIQDYQTTVSEINVSGVSGGTSSVEVVIDDLRHTYIGDLVISIQSPDGFREILHNRSGGSTDNIIGVSYFLSSTSPVIGSNPNGTWSLVIEDRAGADQGNLVGWSLNISGETVSPTTDLIPLTVSGSVGNLTNVDVVIHSLTTGRLDDLMIELVAPNNASEILFNRLAE
jgi:subtilisin-like proprotein convertase family protein